MWEKMAICVRKIAAEVLRVTKGGGCDLKDTWWWNEDVQKAIKKRRNAISACTKTGVPTT